MLLITSNVVRSVIIQVCHGVSRLVLIRFYTNSYHHRFQGLYNKSINLLMLVKIKKMINAILMEMMSFYSKHNIDEILTFYTH